MFQFISKGILSLLGWRITGFSPEEIKKCVVIVIPHTANVDFPLGLLIRSALDARIHFIGKKSLFSPPYGWFFRWLGGYPVDRTKRSRLVDEVVDIFNREDEFRLTLAPEGTRSKVDRLKSGFYYIALKANVPIVMVRFDFGEKEVCLSEPFQPSGDYRADLEQHLYPFYKGVKGYHPEKAFDINKLKPVDQ